MPTIDRGHEPDLAIQQDDARLAFEAMAGGGVAILPLSVSYAIFAHTAEGVERIYKLKQRPMTKPNGVIGNWDIFQDVFEVGQRDRDLVRCLTLDHDLPLSVVAPFNPHHDWLRTVEWGALRRSTKGQTMDLLMNAGPLHNALAAMSLEQGKPLMGSSANASGSGSKFELLEVQEELRAGCELVLGYGRSPYANEFGMGSTIVELPSWRILRWGGCFEAQAAIVEKNFGVRWPERPADGKWSLV
ncbi:MAG: Sua5/YciO/YrdC/YwlC family protein [Ramlibacter sp.]|jgi:tRNA A37 threonylcarbamoyladenosine synthetase subunit TsaC/SUA5/YrdC|uniref:Sua5/YciO/YrdC/YwlC family protein n=1 Tax=Ramlibacter sp. TaxID=1917967 RepID=UPI00262F710F|nr:Sua5/YciO/YrdC/YwlC family protein [Ramlibacter sp.]MDH4374928.1 Sua5/YciO/YrdC/YwlC family protein [Ramlibacter sp.]